MFSILSTLSMVNDEVTEFLKDDQLNLLVSLAKKESNFKDLSISSLRNNWEASYFKSNAKKIFNALIFKEMLKSMAACLSVKELISDMLDSYE